LTLTFHLQSYFSISVQLDTHRVRNVDSPRSKRCEVESNSLRRGRGGSAQFLLP